MKSIYSILSLFFVLITVSVFGQVKIYAPSLKAPADVAVGQMPDVVLDWDAVTGTSLEIYYELELANNAEFENSEVFPLTDLTALTMSDLIFGETYYWHVKAYDDGVASEWSDTWSFAIAWNVKMNNPVDGKEVFSNPEITWTELTGLTGYQMQLDTVYAWNKDESGVTSDIFDSYIVADNNMWAVGADGLVIHNDGSGWSVVDVGVSVDLRSVSFVDANNGYIVGDAGTVLNYDGTTWAVVDAVTTVNLLGVSFADADNGVVVGAGGTIVVFNAGLWQEVTTGDINDLYDVVMLSSTNIWACGTGKIVVHYDGSEWIAEVIGSKDHYSIAMIDANNGWIVGKSGEIFRWNGMLWYKEESGTTKALNGVSFNGMNGYAVGASGTLLKFNGAWNQITSGIGEDLQGVMITADNGLIAGNGGVLIRKSDIGFNSPFLMTYNIPADTSSWQLANLLFGQTFYYRLRAFHAADTSLWSGVKSFTTVAMPELISPEVGDITDLLIKFEWDEYEGTTNYVFQIDVNDNFTTPRSFSPDDDTLWVNDLVFGEEYYWRVAAQHALDISDWSEVWSFSTVNEITQLSPGNNSVGIARCPLFTWEEVAGTSAYELWADIDASFSNPTKYTGENPQYQCQSTLEYGTVYYWKVLGRSGSLVSEWSETWSFETEKNIGIDESFTSKSLNIYPNPGVGDFNIYLNSNVNSEYQMKVVDMGGKLIYETTISCEVGNNNIPISIDNIVSGSYNLIISDGKNVISKKILIN